jgi:hypothetical protein
MYYIYHIPGKKVGCTKRLEQRLKEQKVKLSDCDRIITTPCIKKASQIEKELQIEYGYKIDAIDYQKMHEFSKKGCRGFTPEQRDKGLKKSHEGNLGYKALLEKYGIDYIKSNWDKARISAIEKTSIPVLAYDKLGNFIGEYKSTHDAGRQLNIWQQNICHVLNGKLKSTGGYIFKHKIVK